VKILLTGATGFIGSQVARALVHDGHEVHALILPQDNLTRIADIKGSLGFVESDLLDPQPPTLDFRLDLCLHLAWYVEPGKYLNAPQNLDFLAASLRLAQQLARAGCQRLVVAGTCFEYNTDKGLLNELTPTRPRHVYSACKLALFTALEPFCKSVGISFAWVRFFYQYGPHEDPRRLVPHVIRSLLRGQRAELTPGEQVRDFLHVEDVARAACAVAQSNLTGAVNIGSGAGISVHNLTLKIGDILGRRDLIALSVQPYAPDEPMCVVADNGLLRSRTAWQPRYDLDSGLQQTIQWWKSHM